MNRLMVMVAAIILGSSACGSNTPPQSSADTFNPPAVQPGFTRYVVPDIANIDAGSDVTRCQWLEDAVDVDRYVAKVTGVQSRGGHHVILYATKVREPVGTTRECVGDDLVVISFLGAIGGEGNSTATDSSLPPNIAFMLPKGQALMANTHYLNASSRPIAGHSVMDVQFVTNSPQIKIANLWSQTTIDFSVPPGNSTIELACKFPQPISFFRFANHMHEQGSSTDSFIVRADGKQEDIITNDPWTSDQIFNFPFRNWTLESPLTVNAGDIVHTRCSWNNKGQKTLRFPDEMCAAFAFFVPGTGAQIACVDGNWPSQ